ncbi:hypothetical protein GCM10027521_64460 [Amycolatopsis cihanbeyliensis]
MRVARKHGDADGKHTRRGVFAAHAHEFAVRVGEFAVHAHEFAVRVGEFAVHAATGSLATPRRTARQGRDALCWAA